jgi:hypothetical protein
MKAQIYTGILEGHAGRFIKLQDAQNLQYQIDLMVEALRMIEQAANSGEARGIARDMVQGYERSVATMAGAH